MSDDTIRLLRARSDKLCQDAADEIEHLLAAERERWRPAAELAMVALCLDAGGSAQIKTEAAAVYALGLALIRATPPTVK